jgi:hypothetical protein
MIDKKDTVTYQNVLRMSLNVLRICLKYAVTPQVLSLLIQVVGLQVQVLGCGPWITVLCCVAHELRQVCELILLSL